MCDCNEDIRVAREHAFAEGYADGFGDGGVNAWDLVNPYSDMEPIRD